MDLKWPFCKKFPKKFRIDLICLEMRSKVNFGHPKWPTATILSKFPKTNWSCVSIWNGQKCDRKWILDIQNERRRPFCKKNPYWSKMARNVINDTHFVKNLSFISIWNGQKCVQNWISDIQNGRRWPFCKNVLKKSFILIWNGQKCHRKWILDIQNGRRQPFCKTNHTKKIMVLIWNGKKWLLDI